MKLLRIVASATGWLALAALWFWAWHLKDPHLRFMRAWELPLLSALLLAVYFSAVLGGWRRGLSFGAFVALLYGALYGLLASESNALLLGALLTFGMLATLMLVTRKVDWYALSRRGEATSVAPAAAPETQTAA